VYHRGAEKDRVFFHARIPQIKKKKAKGEVMSDRVFAVEKGYFFNAYADPMEGGDYGASVTFERISDHAKSLVPMVRHKLEGRFSSRHQALDVGVKFGFAAIEKGDVGL
jgi:hypothetical protein